VRQRLLTVSRLVRLHVSPAAVRVVRRARAPIDHPIAAGPEARPGSRGGEHGPSRPLAIAIVAPSGRGSASASPPATLDRPIHGVFSCTRRYRSCAADPPLADVDGTTSGRTRTSCATRRIPPQGTHRGSLTRPTVARSSAHRHWGLEQRAPASVRRVALRDELKVNNANLGGALAELEQQGLVVRSGDGWRLAPPRTT
jgi:hypothetical protein